MCVVFTEKQLFLCKDSIVTGSYISSDHDIRKYTLIFSLFINFFLRISFGLQNFPSVHMHG